MRVSGSSGAFSSRLLSPPRSETSTLILIEMSRYVKEKLALSPNNPSAWNYLRG